MSRKIMRFITPDNNRYNKTRRKSPSSSKSSQSSLSSLSSKSSAKSSNSSAKSSPSSTTSSISSTSQISGITRLKKEKAKDPDHIDVVNPMISKHTNTTKKAQPRVQDSTKALIASSRRSGKKPIIKKEELFNLIEKYPEEKGISPSGKIVKTFLIHTIEKQVDILDNKYGIEIVMNIKTKNLQKFSHNLKIIINRIESINVELKKYGIEKFFEGTNIKNITEKYLNDLEKSMERMKEILIKAKEYNIQIIFNVFTNDKPRKIDESQLKSIEEKLDEIINIDKKLNIKTYFNKFHDEEAIFIYENKAHTTIDLKYFNDMIENVDKIKSYVDKNKIFPLVIDFEKGPEHVESRIEGKKENIVDKKEQFKSESIRYSNLKNEIKKISKDFKSNSIFDIQSRRPTELIKLMNRNAELTIILNYLQHETTECKNNRRKYNDLISELFVEHPHYSGPLPKISDECDIKEIENATKTIRKLNQDLINLRKQNQNVKPKLIPKINIVNNDEDDDDFYDTFKGGRK